VPIRVVLVDDHPIVLNGIEKLLQNNDAFEVVASCGTAAEGLAAIDTLQPDVLVLDLKLPDKDGLHVLRHLDPTRRPAVIVLTASQDEDEWLTAAHLGARGIILKAMAPRVLEDCIRRVHEGGYELSVRGVDLARRLAERRDLERQLSDTLTPRELEVVRLVAARLDNQEIAERLWISVGTVKIHLHHVYDKLQLGGRRDLQQFLQSHNY
jgi:DNA-binding NarL/FixJ family response regulator